MLRNAVEALTGVIVFQDIAQQPEKQHSKKYLGEQSCAPSKRGILAGEAEAMRQVEGSRLQRGGWVGGDAWFGSVSLLLLLFLYFGVFGTFVIKNNTHLFPKRQLCERLKAIGGGASPKAGTWTSCTREFELKKDASSSAVVVTVLCLAYAWSRKGVAYFVSSCGSTAPHASPYQSAYENEWGQVCTKDIPRPSICSFVYEYLPSIDEHNRQRQALLAIELAWPTTDCWMRLVQTIVGMCVVDFKRIMNRLHPERHEKIDILTFADLLVGGMPILPSRLPEVTPSAFAPGDMLAAPGAVGANMPPLVRIKDKDGKTTKPVRQTGDSVRVRAGCKVGPPVQGKCWVCKKYMPAGKYTDTAFCCPRCKTPICKTMFDGRDHASCYAEHEHGAHPCKCTAKKKEGRFEERCKVAGAKKSA